MPLNDSLDAALSQLGYDDEMGAMPRRSLGPRGRALLQSEVAPGVPKPGYKRLVTGLGIATFDNVTRTATLTVAPLKPLIIRKIVATAIPSNPGPGSRQVVIDSILIGSQAQQATGQALPIELFGSQTQDNTVQFDTATPGVPVQINVSHLGAALGAGDTITIVIGAVVDTLG